MGYYDNRIELTFDHNVSGANVKYVGPLTGWSGYALAAGSPGKGAGSDGTDVGIQTAGVPPPTPTPGPLPGRSRSRRR